MRARHDRRLLITELLPAFLGVHSSDIDFDFREHLGLAVRSGGMGIRNPMACSEEFYDTSLAASSYLVETMIDGGEFDVSRHSSHIKEAVDRTKSLRSQLEADMISKRNHGKPAAKRRARKAVTGGTGKFLLAIPHYLNGTILSANEWRDNLRLLYNLEPLDMPQHCDGCGARMTVEHALSCKKGGLVHIRHDDVANEWRWLCRCAFSHSRVEREPYIYSSVGRRERENANATTGTQANSTTPTPTPQQGTTQSTSSVDEKRGDAGVHGFWQNGRLCIFDVRITDTDARSYRNKCPLKCLESHEKEKKDKYLATCQELRKDFTPLVYSVDGMAGREAKMAEKRVASNLANQWHRPYSQMVNYVRMRMRIALARSNSLLIRGSRDREPKRPFIQSGSALAGRQTWEEW